MRKKLITMTLSAVMVVSMAGCGAGSKIPTYDDVEPFVTPTKTNPDKWKFDEPVQVNYCKVLNVDEASQLPKGQSSDSNGVYDYIKEKYNIELVEEWTAGEADYEQQLALHIASGSLPDLIYVNSYYLYKQMIDGALVQPINTAYINQCSDKFLEIEAASGNTMLQTATTDGLLWGVPAGKDADQFDVLWLRKDWLDNLGLKVPKTLEELEEVLKAFTYDDPDGNGKQDTYGLAVNATEPITEMGTANYGLNNIFYSMGVYPDTWLLNEEGHVYNGTTDPKMKDVLSIIQRWYKEGYIDQEFISRTGEGQVEGTISSGQVGAFFGQWWVMPRDQGVLDAEWTAVAAPLNQDGKFSYVRADAWSDCIMVSASCENPEAALAALAISVDIAMDVDHEGYEIAKTLKNGKDVDRNFFPYGVWTTGATDMEDMSKAIVEKLETGSFTPFDNMSQYAEDEINRAYNFYKGTERTPDAAWSYYGRGLAYPEIKSGIGDGVTACWYWDTMSSALINTILDTEFDEILLKIITGQTSVDTYDEFISQWHKLGGDTLITEIEEELGIE